jgi:hypothetical protein
MSLTEYWEENENNRPYILQNLETAQEVRILWQHIDDVLAQQEFKLDDAKILFDGLGNLAVEALDIVVDQLP